MSHPSVVVDTNVLDYIWKGRPLAGPYVALLNGKLLSISFMTVAELYYGMEKARWGEKRRNLLETTLKNYVVIPYDNEISRCYGKIMAERESKGRPITCADAWIAACAVKNGVPIVTHNARDFEHITDLEVITLASQSS